MQRFIILLLAITMIGVGGVLAQDGGDDRPTDRIEDTAFRSLEDIADPAEFEVINFANGTGQLSLTTDIPVACTVVYGTTEAFGQLVFDQQMADFAVIDHNPILTGLESNTTYYYRLQGTDLNGVLYLSDVMTFTTPDFDSGENLNLASPENGAEVIGFSSAFGGADIDERWGAGSAFDGNPATAWSSQGDGNSAWVEVQLAGRARLDRVEFWTRSMGDGSSITNSFTITTETGEVFGPYTLDSATQSYEFEVLIEAETIRFDLTDTTGGNTGAIEIAVYGEFLSD